MMDELLQLSEAATYLGVSRVKMSQLAREGVVPYVTSPLDKRVKLVERKALDALIRGPRPRSKASNQKSL
jgi:predicted site-specific integrase-resolvase